MMAAAAGCVHAPLARWARERPAACAVHDGQRSLSFAALAQAVAERAAALQHARAPAVVLVDDQQSQWDQLLEFLGIIASGRCAAVGDPDWPAAQRDAAVAALQTLALQPVANLSDHPDHNPHANPAESLFYVGFTSGSTGRSKGFCRTHASWTASFEACVQAFGPAATQPILIPGRINHSLFLFGMLLALWSGAGLWLPERFSAAAALRSARGPWPTLVAVPSQLLLMLAYAAQHRVAPIPGTALILISGARWPRQHSAALQALFPNAAIREFYGASELSFVAWTAADADLSPTVVGTPFPGVELAIRPLNVRTLDPETAQEPDAPGLIWVRSPMVFSGYVGDSAADGSACLRDGDWWSVRDIGQFDAAGRLCLLGRMNRMIVTQAKKLFPEELESVLEAHPSIAQASVQAIPDAVRGSRVVAIVAWASQSTTALPTVAQPDAAALTAWCRARVQAYKVPRQFLLCSDWRWTVSGKTDHAALAAEVACLPVLA